MGIKIEKLKDGKYILLEDVCKLGIQVQSGFVTDFASIPKMFWSIIGSPLSGEYATASLIHDALYASEAYSRAECDRLFLVQMEADNVAYWKRTLMYYAVRVGGYFVWKRHTKESINKARMFIRLGVC